MGAGDSSKTCAWDVTAVEGSQQPNNPTLQTPQLSSSTEDWQQLNNSDGGTIPFNCPTSMSSQQQAEQQCLLAPQLGLGEPFSSGISVVRLTPQWRHAAGANSSRQGWAAAMPPWRQQQ
ncbi:hypothetical protein HU200_067689 [Digitaria exilis]|uniref:Uncharacterized protein n=1 Tax=Digitaria exilis TaxID=1010633 RepID=A0A834ZYA2_9POAL|nr:hypothetical protein HU200_067689 [Digitaria exilis]